MAELHAVRHAQASFGADDYDRLSASGERQGVWLGEYFAERGLQFDRVVIGTMRRHEQTLRGIAQGMRIELPEVERNAGLNEYDFHALFDALGDEHAALRAQKRAPAPREFYRALKQVLRLWVDDRMGGTAPETWHAFQARVAAVMRELQQGGGKRVLVVSSGGPIAAMVQQALGAPGDAAVELNMQIRNSSVSQFFFNADAFQLAAFNHVPHLDRADRREFITYG